MKFSQKFPNGQYQWESRLTISPLNVYNYICNYILLWKKSSYKIPSSLIVKFVLQVKIINCYLRDYQFYYQTIDIRDWGQPSEKGVASFLWFKRTAAPVEYQSYAITERNYAEFLRQFCGSIKKVGLGSLKPFMLRQRRSYSDFVFNEGREDQNSIAF